MDLHTFDDLKKISKTEIILEQWPSCVHSPSTVVTVSVYSKNSW